MQEGIHQYLSRPPSISCEALPALCFPLQFSSDALSNAGAPGLDFETWETTTLTPDAAAPEPLSLRSTRLPLAESSPPCHAGTRVPSKP